MFIIKSGSGSGNGQLIGSPKAGKTFKVINVTTITANITNTGNETSNGFYVAFFRNDSYIGNRSIAPLENGTWYLGFAGTFYAFSEKCFFFPLKIGHFFLNLHT